MFALGAGVAVAIEFVQLFFPGRTVSLNDIAAEVFGTAAGIVLWWAGGGRFSRLLGSINFGGPLAIRAAASVYVLGYFALSLFPYDFVVSAAELKEKLSLGLYDPPSWAARVAGWCIAERNSQPKSPRPLRPDCFSA